MYSTSQPVELTDEEREELTARWRARSLRASDATRARLILLLADGVPYRAVADKLGCSQTTVSLWRERFLESRLEGLYGRHRGSRASASAESLEAPLASATCESLGSGREPGSSHIGWSATSLPMIPTSRPRPPM